MFEDTISHYDKTAETYDQQYAAPQWLIHRILTRESLQPYLPRGGLMLDAAAGTGTATPILLSRSRKRRLVSLDASKKMIEEHCSRNRKAIRRGQVFPILGNVLRLPFKNEVFDLVFSEAFPLRVPSLGYLPLRELARVLKTGRYLATSTGTLGNCTIARLLERATDQMLKGSKPRIGIDELRTYVVEGRISWESLFYQFYSLRPSELRDMCRKTGLEVVKITGKPMLAHLLSDKAASILLSRPRSRRQLLELERRLSEEESIIGKIGRAHV
jgi:ubiquinone/menaquinone biosynthesis C-methylase UbiE